MLVSALLVGFTGWLWLDAITAIGVGAAVIWSAIDLLREAVALNLDAAPRGVDLGAVESLLQQLPGVAAVEELHVWGISTARTALTAHLVLENDAVDGERVIGIARQSLAKIGIRKSTLQLETNHQHCHEHQ